MLHNNDKITSFNDKFRYLFNILYIVQKMKFSIIISIITSVLIDQ